jgi:hypothetical protein
MIYVVKVWGPEEGEKKKRKSINCIVTGQVLKKDSAPWSR